jgi:PPK2 family polyphosphate:nucleotide phosphotransferase
MRERHSSRREALQVLRSTGARNHVAEEPHIEKFRVQPGSQIRLKKIDPSYTGKHDSRKEASPELQEQLERLEALQYLLYADASRSLLVVLQGLDASGKDGTVRHIFSGMNPQGTSVFAFKEPTPQELAHDFLWRVHKHTPGKGEVVIFNRSHYEDVLVARVHRLVPESVWSKRYALINDFESMLVESGTCILKFYLHISPQEQLARFKQRLDDKMRNWKISESDYSERKLWPQYVEAYDEALSRTSTKHAPWFVIPADHKWFRNLAISKVVADAMDDMKLKLPPARVDLRDIRRKYHSAEAGQR